MPAPPSTQELGVDRILEAVLSTMKAEPFCFLITLDEAGHPDARLVEATRIDPDMRVWIFTRLDSRKVKEIGGDNRATLAFSDNKGEGYATLKGFARLVNDSEQKKNLWKFQYNAFFPGGPEGDDSILIQFVPHRVEIMHFHLKVGIWPWTMKPATLLRDGESWTLQQ